MFKMVGKQARQRWLEFLHHLCGIKQEKSCNQANEILQLLRLLKTHKMGLETILFWKNFLSIIPN